MKFKETETLELKKSTSELKEGVISIAAILNKHGKGNEIAVFKNRLEIYNPGRFPDDYSPADFIKGRERSVVRNPAIANALFLASDIERWGFRTQAHLRCLPCRRSQGGIPDDQKRIPRCPAQDGER
jgi:hypothetical protein